MSKTFDDEKKERLKHMLSIVEGLSDNQNENELVYFIKGNVRGRDIKAGVIPPDKGGYTVLDIVFDGEMEAELIITPFEIKDVKGKTIKGNTYSVRSYDEDGTVYECPIKPARTSDKSFLNMLLR